MHWRDDEGRKANQHLLDVVADKAESVQLRRIGAAEDDGCRTSAGAHHSLHRKRRQQQGDFGDAEDERGRRREAHVLEVQHRGGERAVFRHRREDERESGRQTARLGREPLHGALEMAESPQLQRRPRLAQEGVRGQPVQVRLQELRPHRGPGDVQQALDVARRKRVIALFFL